MRVMIAPKWCNRNQFLVEENRIVVESGRQIFI